jgi:hypothetical protein
MPARSATPAHIFTRRKGAFHLFEITEFGVLMTVRAVRDADEEKPIPGKTSALF